MYVCVCVYVYMRESRIVSAVFQMALFWGVFQSMAKTQKSSI